jgi:uncharacterized membrane protein YfcA
MSDVLLTFTLLCLAALVAGAVNSIAGGGTLLTFPALLRVVGAVEANATSTFALLPGSFAGAVGYWTELKACRRLIAWLIAPSLLGGLVGSRLVTEFPPEVFERLIPWLILSASVLFLIQGPLKRWTGMGEHSRPRGLTLAAVVAAQFLIAVYGGYFGAGIGILMLSVLPFMGTRNIHETNAAKTFLAAVINFVTILNFVIEKKVVWSYALAMAVAAIAGGYVGARLARRLPAVYVRGLVIAIGFSLGGYYLWKEFVNGN